MYENYSTSEPIRTGSTHTVCGYVRTLSGGRKVFYRKFEAKHYLKSPPALALGVDVIEQLQAAGVDDLQLLDREQNILYECSLDHFLANGFDVDRGWGRQKALRLEQFMRSKKGGGLPTEAAQAVKFVQGSMFKRTEAGEVGEWR